MEHSRTFSPIIYKSSSLRAVPPAWPESHSRSPRIRSRSQLREIYNQGQSARREESSDGRYDRRLSEDCGHKSLYRHSFSPKRKASGTPIRFSKSLERCRRRSRSPMRSFRSSSKRSRERISRYTEKDTSTFESKYVKTSVSTYFRRSRSRSPVESSTRYSQPTCRGPPRVSRRAVSVHEPSHSRRRSYRANEDLKVKWKMKSEIESDHQTTKHLHDVDVDVDTNPNLKWIPCAPGETGIPNYDRSLLPDPGPKTDQQNRNQNLKPDFSVSYILKNFDISTQDVSDERDFVVLTDKWKSEKFEKKFPTDVLPFFTMWRVSREVHEKYLRRKNWSRRKVRKASKKCRALTEKHRRKISPEIEARIEPKPERKTLSYEDFKAIKLKKLQSQAKAEEN